MINSRFIKISILTALIFASQMHVYAQDSTKSNPNIIKKLIKKFTSSQKDSLRSPSFFVLPAFGYSQETGIEYGIASTYDFYVDKNDLSSRTSNIMLMGTMTTKKQKNIKLLSDIWTRGNEYHILSEFRFRDWPFNFYGIGNETWEQDKDYIDQKLYRMKLDVEKHIAPRFYLGVNINYDNFEFSDRDSNGIFQDLSVIGKEGGQYLALGMSALYDTRNNTTYTTKGVYARAKYSFAPNFFGKDNFTGSQLELDVRNFNPLTKNLTIGIQGLYRGSYGKNIPFYVLRELGGDMTMRGYYLGRYKDKNYITAQAELRYRLHPRVGLNGFLGTGSTFSNEQNIRLVPSYGAGLRYFFSLEHNSTIRFDYAVGEKRTGEPRQSGFYISISEAF